LVQIERVDVEPFERFPDPHIRLRVLVKVGSPHILIYPSLGVAIGDGINSLWELGTCLLAQESRPDFTENSESQVDFLLALTPNIIKKIEEARTKEGKGNVLLKVKFSASVLHLTIQAHKDPSGPRGEVAMFGVSSRPLSERVSVDSAPRISSSDWVNEYQRRLGLGKAVLLEIPFDMDDVIAHLQNMQDKELAGRVVDAARALDHANRLLREGRWRDSVRQSRDALEVLKSGKLKKEDISVTQSIKNLVEEADLPAEAGDHLTQIIDRLYSFASATHLVSRKEQTVDLAVFEKEDAVFVLTCVGSIISMIARKLRRAKR
jgi:HEPN domain-containing protein